MSEELLNNCIEWEYPRVAYSLISDHHYPSRCAEIDDVLEICGSDPELLVLVFATWGRIARLEAGCN